MNKCDHEKNVKIYFFRLLFRTLHQNTLHHNFRKIFYCNNYEKLKIL